MNASFVAPYERHRPHHRTEVTSRPQVLSETSFAANSRLSQIKEKLTVEVVSAIDDHLKVRALQS